MSLAVVNRPLSVALVGFGEMGQNHARCLASMKDVDLVAIVDPDEDRRNLAAARYECESFSSVSELPEVGAAVVAVPTAQHSDVGCFLMSRGVHCLIEKPLALDRAEAELLVDLAESENLTLQVGHIERFNPAVRQLGELLAGEQVLVANARRMSAVSGRVIDIDVVMDLMVHDLDVVLNLMGGQVEGVVSQGVRGTNGYDHATALLSFDGGRMASLTASRITQNQIRQLEVTTSDGFFIVDYPSQELLIFRQGRIEGVGGNAAEVRYPLDVDTRRVFVRRSEPLLAELEHFVGTICGRRENEATGREALEVLELVWRVQRSLREEIG
jgi:predicted dehydrogenase